MKRLLVATLTMGVALLSHTPRAEACGCLALPSPATPVVQAGERILFAHENGQVVAYIQIQYQGSASEFGWLVPLPSVPTLELGTDEVFTQLGRTTQPTYQLTTTNTCTGGSSTSAVGFGCGSDAASRGGGIDASFASDLGLSMADAGSPVVVQDSVGPFDYAVLKADNQTEMLDWLSANRYFVPAGTDQAMSPYIRPGAYFLALKLKAGQTTGDITPIVVRYSSDLPMIPIILTQVGAVPDMGILVWMLGNARAIPRNYHHTVLNDMGVWLGESSYPTWVVKAIKEAPLKHSFITEYAGSSAVMKDVLDYAGRFGNLATLRTRTDPSDYLDFLRANGYLFDSTLYAILERHLPIPASVKANGVPREIFYANYDSFVTSGSDGGPAPAFDPVAITDEIEMRIVVPTRKTGQLFRAHPYLTRLYTALSPEDMTADPVFSENPDLPDVGLVKRATLTIPCSRSSAWIRSEEGFEAQYVFPAGGGAQQSMPASLRVETLREEGAPEVVTNNAMAIKAALGPVSYGSNSGTSSNGSSSGGGGCACDVNGVPLGNLAPLFFLLGPAGALVLRRLRRRRP